MAAQNADTNYALGSVLNHVLLHQTIIGEEALLQLAKVGETPDLIVGCTGGGSNFGGLAFPFLREKLAGRMAPVIRAVEPAACPSLTRGVYAYDFGDTAGMTPLMKMHTLGHDFIPDPIHAGGLRYHGMSPLISHLYEQGLIEAIAKPQRECFAAGVQFARTEGIVPAPEPTHAIAGAIEEALRCKESGEAKVILTALCGHGHLDLPAYDAYLSGAMQRPGAGRRRDRGGDRRAARGPRLTWPRSRSLPRRVRLLQRAKLRRAGSGERGRRPSGSLSARNWAQRVGLVRLADRAGGLAERMQRAQEPAVGLVRPRHRALALPAGAAQRVEPTVVAGARVGVGLDRPTVGERRLGQRGPGRARRRVRGGHLGRGRRRASSGATAGSSGSLVGGASRFPKWVMRPLCVDARSARRAEACWARTPAMNRSTPKA